MSQPRLTGGAHRGRVLPCAVAPGVRPSAARVREALFSIVGQDLGGERFLDAFGGSGLVALEAWSRGASVVVVERDRRAAAAIRANAAALGADVDLRAGDVLALAADLGAFDVVFADPPYRDPAAPVIAALAPLVRGVLVLEVADATPTPAPPPGMALDRRRAYGDTALAVYRPG
ncbi:MAG: RsmD family RNA methyltransferase [Myxococcota bacterium]